MLLLRQGVGVQGKPWTKKTQFQNWWYIIFAYESRVVFFGGVGLSDIWRFVSRSRFALTQHVPEVEPPTSYK